MTKRALLSGITGQVGSYLAELLLEKGYEVHGLIRRASSFNTGRIDHIFDRLHLHYGDLSDASSIRRAIDRAEPDELYNLGAQSHVQVSFEIPEYSADITALGPVRLLDAIPKTTRFYQASSSELFGDSPAPQNELTPIRPRSPYACAKAHAYYLTRHYRDRGYFAVNGILFNTESPRRGETFVTRKIARYVGRLSQSSKKAQFPPLALGNTDAKRDWGHAREYVEGIWTMMQADEPDDYVLGTGESHTVNDLLDEAFKAAGVTPMRHSHVVLDAKYLRPTEVPHLLADASKMKRVLGWEPKLRFADIVKEMVDHDVVLAQKECRAIG